MKPFDDSIPEEREENQEQLIALLRQAYSREQALAETEQQETIMHVEERLAGKGWNFPSQPEQIPAVSEGTFVFRSQSKSSRQRPAMRTVSTIAAVLVAAILLGSTILLYTQQIRPIHPLVRQIVTPIPPSPTTTTDSTDVTWNGLEMSIKKITPGPYFLGELLAVDLSLTNHTHPTLTLGGMLNTTDILFCGYSYLDPLQTGGTAPHYTLFTTPVNIPILCNDVLASGPTAGPALSPGHTVTGHFYVLLTASGDVKLVGAAFFFLPETIQQGGTVWKRNSGPLTGHLPTLHIHVAPQAPANRTLSIQQENSEAATIQAPPGVHLLDQTYVICQDTNGNPWAYGTAYNRNYWEPLNTNALQRTSCNGNALAQWKFAVGAVGYKIVQGEQGHYSGLSSP